MSPNIIITIFVKKYIRFLKYGEKLKTSYFKVNDA